MASVMFRSLCGLYSSEYLVLAHPMPLHTPRDPLETPREGPLHKYSSLFPQIFFPLSYCYDVPVFSSLVTLVLAMARRWRPLVLVGAHGGARPRARHPAGPHTLARRRLPGQSLALVGGVGANRVS
jgi:hypothetical protein